MAFPQPVKEVPRFSFVSTRICFVSKVVLIEFILQAERHWSFWYNHCLKGCLHGHKCARRAEEGFCDFGGRLEQIHVLTGDCLAALLADVRIVRSGAQPFGCETPAGPDSWRAYCAIKSFLFAAVC
jgi:hypothetical protein